MKDQWLDDILETYTNDKLRKEIFGMRGSRIDTILVDLDELLPRLEELKKWREVPAKVKGLVVAAHDAADANYNEGVRSVSFVFPMRKK